MVAEELRENLLGFSPTVAMAVKNSPIFFLLLSSSAAAKVEQYLHGLTIGGLHLRGLSLCPESFIGSPTHTLVPAIRMWELECFKFFPSFPELLTLQCYSSFT